MKLPEDLIQKFDKIVGLFPVEMHKVLSEVRNTLLSEVYQRGFKDGAVKAIHSVMSIQSDNDLEVAKKVEDMLFNSK